MQHKCESCGQAMEIPDRLAGRELSCRKCETRFTVPDTKPCPYCAEMIKIAAKVCKHCKRDLDDFPSHTPATESPKQSKVSPLVAIMVIAVAVGIVWVVITTISTGGSKSTTSSGRYIVPQPMAAAPPVVTKAEYDQLRDGISYDQAVRIIGASGDELSRSDIAGFTTVMYSWTNTNGSNMNAMFQNGGLVQKAQFGLP